jgi:hypothetical protein
MQSHAEWLPSQFLEETVCAVAQALAGLSLPSPPDSPRLTALRTALADDSTAREAEARASQQVELQKSGPIDTAEQIAVLQAALSQLSYHKQATAATLEALRAAIGAGSESEEELRVRAKAELARASCHLRIWSCSFELPGRSAARKRTTARPFRRAPLGRRCPEYSR